MLHPMTIPIEIVVVILTVIFGILSALIAFTLKSLDANTKAIDKINVRLDIMQVEGKYEDKEYNNRNEAITQRLKEHENRLDIHEKRIATCENLLDSLG